MTARIDATGAKRGGGRFLRGMSREMSQNCTR